MRYKVLYKVLYNPPLLINDMIVLGDTLLNMSVNVKYLSNKINLKKNIFNTVNQYNLSIMPKRGKQYLC